MSDELPGPTRRVRSLTLGEILAEIPNVDASDVLERARGNQALQAALDLTRPRNWWGCGVAGEKLLRLSAEDGIPLAWLPPRHVVAEIAAARDRATRIGVLLAHEQEVVDLAAELIVACADPWLADTQPLAARVMDAWRDGHREAAMTLAVDLVDPLARGAAEPRALVLDSDELEDWEKQRKQDLKRAKYARAVRLTTLTPTISNIELASMAVRAPIPRFFATWNSDKGIPPPRELSRHVVAHQPRVDHLTHENGLIAVMLLASLLRDLQEWAEEVRSNDYDREDDE